MTTQLHPSRATTGPAAFERRRHPRTVEGNEAYVAYHESAEYRRKLDVALNVLADDARGTVKAWRTSETYKRFQLDRLRAAVG